MGRRLEVWLDRRKPIKEGQASFSEEARQRIFSREQGLVAVPNRAVSIDKIGAGISGETLYRLDGPAAQQHASKAVPESEVCDVELVDARILGEPGNRYDEVFEELRGPGVQERYDYIRHRAGRYMAGAPLVMVTALAFVAARLVHQGYLDSANCLNRLDPHEYIEPASAQNLQTPGVLGHCALNGQNYVIREDSPK